MENTTENHTLEGSPKPIPRHTPNFFNPVHFGFACAFLGCGACFYMYYTMNKTITQVMNDVPPLHKIDSLESADIRGFQSWIHSTLLQNSFWIPPETFQGALSPFDQFFERLEQDQFGTTFHMWYIIKELPSPLSEEDLDDLVLERNQAISAIQDHYGNETHGNRFREILRLSFLYITTESRLFDDNSIVTDFYSQKVSSNKNCTGITSVLNVTNSRALQIQKAGFTGRYAIIPMKMAIEKQILDPYYQQIRLL